MDKQADILYTRLREDQVYEESEEVEPGVILDFDADGTVIGIEILNFSARLVQEGSESA
jgi:uncharacterized protein YuzE